MRRTARGRLARNVVRTVFAVAVAVSVRPGLAQPAGTTDPAWATSPAALARQLDALPPARIAETEAVVRELARRGPAAREAGPALRRALARSPLGTRIAIGRALWRVEGDTQPLYEACVVDLRSSSGSLRIAAASNLGDLGPRAERAAPGIRPMLAARNPLVRIQAAEALARITPKDAAPAQVIADAIGSDDPATRIQATYAAGAIDRSHRGHVIPALERASRSEDDRVKVAATIVLASIEEDDPLHLAFADPENTNDRPRSIFDGPAERPEPVAEADPSDFQPPVIVARSPEPPSTREAVFVPEFDPTPTVQQTPPVELTPPVEPMPIVDATPAVEPTPIVEPSPVVEPSPPVEVARAVPKQELPIVWPARPEPRRIASRPVVEPSIVEPAIVRPEPRRLVPSTTRPERLLAFDDAPQPAADPVVEGYERRKPSRAPYRAKPLSSIRADITIPDADLREFAEERFEESPGYEALAGDLHLVHTMGTCRPWILSSYYWQATCFAHEPLYFENPNSERYGQQRGKLVQPFVEAGRFFGSIPIMPYMVGAMPPGECQYVLGHYRPGDCVPCMHQGTIRRGLHPDVRKQTIRGAALQAVSTVGLIYIVP